VDSTIPAIHTSFSAVFPTEQERVHNELELILPDLTAAEGQRLAAEQAFDYLVQLLNNLEEVASHTTARYSSIRWIYYTRRIARGFFGGEIPSTAPSHHSTFEALTGLTGAKGQDQSRTSDAGSTVYPTDQESIRPVARLAALAQQVSAVHSMIRMTGKGAAIVVTSDALPKLDASPELLKTTLGFDMRASSQPPGVEIDWFQGLDFMPAQLDEDVLLTLALAGGTWPRVPGWIGSFREGHPVEVMGQYVMSTVGLATLRKALVRTPAAQNSRWWDPALPSLVVLLESLGHHMALTATGAGINLPKVGYTVMESRAFMDLLTQYVPTVAPSVDVIFDGQAPRSASEVVSDLESLPATMWPLRPGPVLRHADDRVAIDVYAATRRLQAMVTMPRNLGGDVVNQISFAFEEHVQAVLDVSTWAPAEDLRQLRGKTLARDGRHITDIDAIGQKGNTLLVVSCKNYPYTEDYDSGAYPVVRNIETALQDAIAHWEAFVVDISSNPVGSNFNFSEFDRIVGLVVTPRVLFVRDSRAHTKIQLDGTVSQYCSLAELGHAVAPVAES
jgi:hypothetical protein